MLASGRSWTRFVVLGGLLIAGSIVIVLHVSAFPGTSPPGFRTEPPSQPPVPFIPPRQVDDQRFVRPSQQAQQAQTSGQTSGGASGLQGGLSGLSALGAGGGGFGGSFGGGGMFGLGRMARMGGANPGQANQTFYGTFNFGGFKGYGFGGGDMSSHRSANSQ
jgi:hypothetical protein